MDPKMDSGIDAEGVYTLEEARSLKLISDDLSIDQVIAIIDRLFCCEVQFANLLTTTTQAVLSGDEKR